LITSSSSFQNAAKRREFLCLSCEEYHGVIFLQYRNLSELITQSRSSRKYFLSLPAEFQMRLHGQNDYIHSAHQLHLTAELIKIYDREIMISESLDRYFK